ncbi:MAG: MBL fold metallo-hydrolase [Candidatus Hydrogenedentes bacterium]|nr:MBL fold metallo-hydrolase [Candidatus Hydrogenedentota bacterium]
MEILSFVTTPFAENAFVLKDGDEAIVIDPGEATEELLDALTGLTVRTLVNTHTHIDHVGGNAEVIARTGAELVCHPDAVEMLEHVAQQGAMFGMEVSPSPAPTRLIEAGDVVNVGTLELKVVYVPGHAPGHIALVGDGFIIGGDVLFAGSVGRTDLPGGDMQVLMNSIRTEFLTLPDETVVYCGHGPSTTVGMERKTNPFIASL